MEYSEQIIYIIEKMTTIYSEIIKNQKLYINKIEEIKHYKSVINVYDCMRNTDKTLTSFGIKYANNILHELN